MNDKAIENIERIVKESQSQIMKCDGIEPSGFYYVREGSTLRLVKSQLKPLVPIAQELQTIADFANRYPNDSSLWIGTDEHSQTIVKCLMRDRPELDGIAIGLRYSEPFAVLVRLAKEWRKTPFTQADLVLTLRTTFGDCMVAELLACVRAVRFRTQAESSGVIEKGKASVGRSIEQQVSGAKEIPDVVAFNLPVYTSGHNCQVVVRCAIEVDMSTERFYLIPLPGQIESALERARQSIASWLIGQLDEGNPIAERVYFGHP